MSSKMMTYGVGVVVAIVIIVCVACVLTQGSDDPVDDEPTTPSAPEDDNTSDPIESPRWHTVVFDPYGDGSAYDYVYVDIGDRLEEPNDPADYCRVFTGWLVKDSSEEWDFSKVVSSDMILVGQWEDHFSVEKGLYSATLTLDEAWTGGSTLIDWGDGTTDSLSAGESVAYHEYSVSTATVEVVTILDGTAYSSTYRLTNLSGSGHASMLRTFTITFESGNGSSVATQIVTWGEYAHSPRAPTATGSIFLGWYYGGSLYDFSQPVYMDMILVARWAEDTDYETPVYPEPEVDVVSVSEGWILDASESVDATHFEWYVNDKLEGVDVTLTISYEKLAETNGSVRVVLYATSETMNYRTWTYWFGY